jgi:hypothetical protein
MIKRSSRWRPFSTSVGFVPRKILRNISSSSIFPFSDSYPFLAWNNILRTDFSAHKSESYTKCLLHKRETNAKRFFHFNYRYVRKTTSRTQEPHPKCLLHKRETNFRFNYRYVRTTTSPPFKLPAWFSTRTVTKQEWSVNLSCFVTIRVEIIISYTYLFSLRDEQRRRIVFLWWRCRMTDYRVSGFAFSPEFLQKNDDGRWSIRN